MEQLRKNKELIINYFNAVSGVVKTRALMEKYTTDKGLMSHIEFFDTAFPCYEIFADEMTAEGNRVIVKARIKGIHKGVLNGIAPTQRLMDFPFAIRYEIENNKIVSHWLIADQALLLEQLGITPVTEAAH